MSEETTEAAALPSEAAIGRVTIRVDSLDRVIPFYRGAIGCQVERDGSTASLSAADGQVLLEFEEVPGASTRPRAAAGLFHAAIRLPDRPSLAEALARLRDAGASLSGASDHLVSEALYLQDPAGNGLELYRDRPREAWSRLDDGRVEMDTLPLDLDDLASARDAPANGDPGEVLPAGTDVGHVHLEVTDLGDATDFYVDDLGFRRTSEYVEGARFVAAGDYHHHVGLNVWNRRTEPAGDHQGVARFEVVLPGTAARDELVERLNARGREVDVDGAAPSVVDPDGIEVALPVRAPPNGD